ncbi:MAG: hypothetical protein AAFY71_26485 [Bacteroidota bacterium]
MKTSNIFFGAILLLMLGIELLGCRIDGSRDVYQVRAIRQISNETDYQVSIQVFGSIDTFSYTISPQSILTIEGFCYESNGEEECFMDWNQLAFGQIVFDGEKIQRFELTDPDIFFSQRAINSSVFNRLSYTLVEDSPDLRVYQYNITETDYFVAEKL